MASRPLDFRVTLPPAVSRVEFLLALVKKAPKGVVRSFQHQDESCFELRAMSLDGASALKGLAHVEVLGETIPLVSLETNLTVVTISKAPVAMDDSHVVSALSQYGTVKEIKRETYEHPELSFIETGNRRVIMEMRSPVPNFLRIRGKRIIIRYPGMRRVCFRCGQSGHFKRACTALACERCGEVGHRTCERPCRRCGGDHSVKSCTVKTWASRVAAVSNGSGTDVRTSDDPVGSPQQPVVALAAATEVAEVVLDAAAPQVEAPSGAVGETPELDFVPQAEGTSVPAVDGAAVQGTATADSVPVAPDCGDVPWFPSSSSLDSMSSDTTETYELCRQGVKRQASDPLLFNARSVRSVSPLLKD